MEKKSMELKFGTMAEKKTRRKCADCDHDYQAFSQADGWTIYGYTTTHTTLLYCTKCGDYIFVKKTPAQYSPTSNVTWSRQTNILSFTAGSYTFQT